MFQYHIASFGLTANRVIKWICCIYKYIVIVIAFHQKTTNNRKKKMKKYRDYEKHRPMCKQVCFCVLITIDGYLIGMAKSHVTFKRYINIIYVYLCIECRKKRLPGLAWIAPVPNLILSFYNVMLFDVVGCCCRCIAYFEPQRRSSFQIYRYTYYICVCVYQSATREIVLSRHHYRIYIS